MMFSNMYLFLSLLRICKIDKIFMVPLLWIFFWMFFGCSFGRFLYLFGCVFFVCQFFGHFYVQSFVHFLCYFFDDFLNTLNLDNSKVSNNFLSPLKHIRFSKVREKKLMYFIFPNFGPLKYIRCLKMTLYTKVHFFLIVEVKKIVVSTLIRIFSIVDRSSQVLWVHASN